MTNYDKSRAAFAVQLAAAIYPDGVWPRGVRVIADIPMRPGRCVVLMQNCDIWVVFRGTTDLADLLMDFDIGRKTIASPDIQVHAGFDDSVDSAWVAIANAILSVLSPDSKLFFCGHSAGATKAILAAARCVSYISPLHDCIAGLFAFAPARPGNAAFRDRYNARLGSRTWCFQHGADIVPWEAPYYLGNRGVGQVVWFPTPNPNLNPNPPVLNPPLLELGLYCAMVTVAGWRRRPPQIEQLADHRVSSYVRLLTA